MPSTQEISSVALKTATSEGIGFLVYSQPFNVKRTAKDAAAFAVSKYFLQQRIQDLLVSMGALNGMTKANAALLTDMIGSLGISAGLDMVMGREINFMRKLVKYGGAEVAGNLAKQSMPDMFQ